MLLRVAHSISGPSTAQLQKREPFLENKIVSLEAEASSRQRKVVGSVIVEFFFER